MLEKKTLICIICPVGCQIEVCRDDDNIRSISGYGCKRGKEYAISELLNPVRTITSTVTVRCGEHPVVPVKTDKPIPKHLITELMREINKCSIQAPVRMGDIVLQNVLNTGANIIATGNIPVLEQE